MSSRLPPKFVVIDDFLPEDLLCSLDDHVRADPGALELMDLGGLPQEGHYSALRKLWVHKQALGPLEPAFRAAVIHRFADLCDGTGIPRFEVAKVETKVCAQIGGSFFAKHVDIDTGEERKSRDSDRLISTVYYFPREPLGFCGGELTLYDFTGNDVSARVEPKRNRFIAFPSCAYHEVTPVTATGDGFGKARWSISCWPHRARPAPNS